MEVYLSSHIWASKSRRKRMHAYGVCPLSPTLRPRWAALPRLQFGGAAFFALRSVLSACARQGGYHHSRRALHVVETPDGRLSKRLICRFLRSGERSSPHDSYFLANTQNFLLAVPVANTFALWYNKSKELEEFQNNYAIKFPFAIASSSPGPRPKQQKGSAIP